MLHKVMNNILIFNYRMLQMRKRLSKRWQGAQNMLCYSIFTTLFHSFLPASVIKPRFSRSAQRCLLSSVQWLPLRRGERRCTRRPSGRRFNVESIHPKHRASSTTSIYATASHSGRFVRYITTQQQRPMSDLLQTSLLTPRAWQSVKDLQHP